MVCDFKTDQDSSMTRHRKAEHGHVPSGPKQRGGRKQNVGDIPEDVLVGRPGAGGEFIPYLPGESFGVYRKCAPTQQARTTSLVHIPQVYGSSLPGTVVHDNGRQTTSRPQQHPLFTLPPLLPRSERQERAVQLPPFATLVRQAHAGSSSWPDHRAPTVLPPTSTSTSFGVGVLATPAPSASSSFSPRPIMTEVNSSQAAVPCAFAMGNYAPQFPSHFQSADSHIPSYRRLRPATYWSTGSRTLAQGGAAGRA